MARSETPTSTDATASEISVEKHPTRVGPNLTVVRFRIEAADDEPRIVRLVDDLPPDVEGGDLGIDPGGDGPEWRHEDGRIWLTAVVEGGTVEARYGVRGADADADAFDRAPRVDAVLPLERETPSLSAESVGSVVVRSGTE
jgi:hypothetical protein